MKAHEQGFLQKDAGAAKGVNEGGGFGDGAAKVDENLGEFGREHADLSVARGASLIATSVGVDILDADDAVVAVIGFDELDFVGVFAGETVMERSGGRQYGSFVLDNAYGATVADQDFFQF